MCLRQGWDLVREGRQGHAISGLDLIFIEHFDILLIVPFVH